MSGALTVAQTNGGQIVALGDIERMAGYVVKSNLFGVKTIDQAVALMLIAQSEGIHPMRACQEYDIIQGKPAINSRAALSRFQNSGGRIQWTKRTDEECSAVFTHPHGGEVEITWNMKRATQAGLTGKDNWKKIPCQMLSARVVAEGVRAVFPACLSGLYTVEEVQDFTEAPAPRPQTTVNVSQVASLKDKLKPQDKQEAPEAPPLVMDAEEVPTDTYITEAQGNDIMGQIKASRVDAKSFLTHFGISRLGELRESQLNEVYDWILDAGKE
jgi:hypothetical protein